MGLIVFIIIINNNNNLPYHPTSLPPFFLLCLSGEGGVVLLRGLRGVFLVRVADAAALPRTTRGAVPRIHEHRYTHTRTRPPQHHSIIATDTLDYCL